MITGLRLYEILVNCVNSCIYARISEKYTCTYICTSLGDVHMHDYDWAYKCTRISLEATHAYRCSMTSSWNFKYYFNDHLVIESSCFVLQIGKIDVYSNVSSDFDWNDLLTNTNNLARNLGLFFQSMKPPPVSDFFLYKGNMTAWLSKLNSALAASTTPESAIRR